MKQIFIVTVESDSPDVDLAAEMRAATGWLYENMDADGHYDMSIEVATAEGEHVVRHEYVADLDDDDEACQGHESLSGAHMGETVYCDGSCR